MKWEKEFNLEVDSNWWKTKKVTNDIQIRWFQYRIMRRILATNTFLCKIGITDSELCTFCNEYPETLNHLFWECEYTSEIWEEIHEWIKELSGIDIYMNTLLLENNINAVTLSIYYSV